jgi:hypothetical protein
MTRSTITFSVLATLVLCGLSFDASAQTAPRNLSSGLTFIPQTYGPSTDYNAAMQAHGPRSTSRTPSANQMTTQQRINTIYQRGDMAPARLPAYYGGGLPMRDSLQGLTAARNFYPQQYQYNAQPYQYNYQQAQFNAQQLQKNIQDLSNAIQQVRQNRQQRLNGFNNNYRRW